MRNYLMTQIIMLWIYRILAVGLVCYGSYGIYAEWEFRAFMFPITS